MCKELLPETCKAHRTETLLSITGLIPTLWCKPAACHVLQTATAAGRPSQPGPASLTGRDTLPSARSASWSRTRRYSAICGGIRTDTSSCSHCIHMGAGHVKSASDSCCCAHR